MTAVRSISPRQDEALFKRTSCGQVAINLASEIAILRQSGALWLPESRTLVVADLHLEKGSAYARTGQLLPPFDSAHSLSRLGAEAAHLAPDEILLLGDSFHDEDGERRLSAESCQRIEALAAIHRLVWIVGNHDRDGPRILPGQILASRRIGALTLRHDPLAGQQPGEVSGHLHPCARIRGRGRTLRLRCFVTDGVRLILPAFGAYAGGLNVCDPAFADLFSTCVKVAALGPDAVHVISPARLIPD